jgi:3-hydroxyacyl-[acyl-carrier-protein] dehydratase
MRWFWIDRITHLDKGKTARAVKNVTLAEEHLHDHFPGFPVMPQSLIIEGMAQTAGILSGSTVDFKENIVLAKVERASFYRLVTPGDQLVFDAELVETRPEGHRAYIRVTVDGELAAEGSMMFVNLNSNAEGHKVFVFTEGLMGLLSACPPSPTGKESSGGTR